MKARLWCPTDSKMMHVHHFQATDLDSEITEGPHPLPISEADGLDAPLRPVLQYLEHAACRQG